MRRQATQVYGDTAYAVVSGARLEAMALLNIAARLQQARTAGEKEPLHHDAVQRNYRLWLLFLSEQERNPDRLPPALRANILGLCGYIVKTALAALSGNEAVLEAWVEINRAVADGLLNQAGNEPVEDPSQALGQEGADGKRSLYV